MGAFRDIWNLVVTGDTSDVDRKLKGLGRTTEDTGDTVDTTFRGRMSASLGNFAQKIPGVSGLMDKFGVSSSQAGAVMGTAVAGGAAVAGAAVAKFVSASIDQFQTQAQEVLHFKQVTGLAAEEASKFVAVADDFGVAASDLSTEVGRLNKVAGTTPEKLQALGIEIAKTKDGGYDAQQTFLNVVDAFNATDDASKRAAIGSAAFGKNWQSMTKLLDQGSVKLNESFAAVDTFQLFNDEDLAKSEAYRHALDDLGDALRGVERSIGEALVPLLTEAADKAADFATNADKTLKPLGGIKGTAEKAADGLIGIAKGFVDGLNPVAQWNKLVGEGKDIWGHFFGDAPSDALKRGFENIDAQASKTTESILADAAAIARHKEESDKAAESARIYQENNEGLRKSLDAQREAAEKATQALKDYRQATHDLLNEQLGLEGATNTAKDAIDDFNTKVLDHTTTVKDLRDANLGVRESWVSLGDQAVATAKQQAELHGATLDANGAVAAQVSALQGLYAQLAPDSPLRVALDQYLLQLYNIPGQIVTNVDITGNGLDVIGRAIGGTRREGSGAGAAAMTPAQIVGGIKAYESSNGTGWRSSPQ